MTRTQLNALPIAEIVGFDESRGGWWRYEWTGEAWKFELIDPRDMFVVPPNDPR
jgi:hypothetical protein